MRLKISYKIFAGFALLISLSLLMGGGVLLTLKKFASLRNSHDTVVEFQYQVKSLQSLKSEVILNHVGRENDMPSLSSAFSRVQGLATEVDLLFQEYGITQQLGVESLAGQVVSFQQAFLKLFKLYKTDLSFSKNNNNILELIGERTSVVSIDKRGEIDSLLTTLLMLQIRIHHDRAGNNLAKIKIIDVELAKLVGDPQLHKGIDVLIRNIEKNYFNYLAIENREQFLSKTANNFERVSRLAASLISANLDEQRARLSNLIIVLCLLLFIVTVGLWLLTSRYFRHNLTAMGKAVRSIRAGDFDYKVHRTQNDEFGDLLLFVKEMADSLKGNLARIEDSEKKFRGLVENISDWTWAANKRDICIYSSPQVEKIVGSAAHEIIDLSVLQVVGREATAIVNDPFLECVSSRNPFDDLVHKVVGVGGELVELETSGRPVADRDGLFNGYRFISRDISERRANENKLKQNSLSQQLQNQLLGLSLLDLELDDILDRFLTTVLAASWLQLEPAGVIFLVNDTGNALDMKAQVGLNSNLQEACLSVPHGVCLCGRVAQTGKVLFCDTVDERHEITYAGLHLHGHYCVPIHSVAGEVVGVFTVYIKAYIPRDPHVEAALVAAATILGGIIKRRQIQGELYQLNLHLENQVESRTAQLTAANKELDTFAYSVSHDLRAPLRAVDGFSQALAEDYGDKLDAEGREFIARILNGCQKMGQLIDDILQLSRLTRGEINRASVDLSGMAADILNILAQGDKKGQGAEWQIAPNLEINADPVMIRAVLDNLLGNAWKYSAKVEHPRIEFGATEKGGATQFWIKDNGAGFDMQYKEKLFVAFQRLHTSSEFEGTGVGLATVQRIIHRHGGRVWAESEEGQGTTFYFCL